MTIDNSKKNCYKYQYIIMSIDKFLIHILKYNTY